MSTLHRLTGLACTGIALAVIASGVWAQQTTRPAANPPAQSVARPTTGTLPTTGTRRSVRPTTGTLTTTGTRRVVRPTTGTLPAVPARTPSATPAR